MRRSLPQEKQQLLRRAFFFIAFFLLVLLGAYLFVYFGWQKSGKKEGPQEEQSLEGLILRSLASQNIPSAAINAFKDEKNSIHLKVDLPLQKYTQLEPFLKKTLQDFRASILKNEKEQGDNQIFILWQVVSPNKEKVTLLFNCQEDNQDKRDFSFPKPVKRQVAIIVDDMGSNLEAIRALCSLRRPLTISIIPYSPEARLTAQLAHECGLEVMLHLPLESLNLKESENSRKGMIYSGMSKEEIRQDVQKSLEQVPLSKGVNNHTGSKITEDAAIMFVILEVLKERNLYFIDSRTSRRSIAYETAQKMGIPTAERRIFLDAESSEDYIKKKLKELFQLAQKKAKVVGICHPLETTLHTLKENLALADEFGVELVFASQIVEKREEGDLSSSQR